MFPFLRIATALAQRGMRVTLVAPAVFADVFAEQMAEQGSAAGLDFHPLPVDAAVLDDPDLWHPVRGFGVVWRATRVPMAEFVRYVGTLSRAPDLIVAHPLALDSADLCRSTHPGVHIVAAYLAPSNLRTVYEPLALGSRAMPAWLPPFARRWLWRAVEALVLHPAALDDINRARAGRAMPKVTSMLDHLHGLADLSVTLFPAWFGPPQPDWPQPLCMGDFPLHDLKKGRAPALPAGLATFLAAGEAPLVFTHGTGNRQAARYFAAAIEAAGRLGRRAILLTPERSQVPDELPATVWWQDYVPLQLLLVGTNVAALIHHGGIGTTAEALRAAVPQLIVPMAFDQFDNAARVSRLGVGHTLPAARVTGKALANQLLRLLAEPRVRTACKAVRAHFQAPSQLDLVIGAIRFLISKPGKN